MRWHPRAGVYRSHAGASAHVRVAIGYAASRIVRVGLLTRPLGERLCVTCGAKFLKEYFRNIIQTEIQV